MTTFARPFALAAAVGALGLLAACSGKPASEAAGTGDMDMGNPKAKVTLVEYASNTCSHCARFDRDVFPTLKAKYIDTGKIHYVFREFLTPPEPVAAAGFLLARCAGKDKYFEVVEALFRSQEEMFSTGDFKTPFTRIAKSMGMSEEQMTACTSDEAALNALHTRVQRAMDVDKITGTPTFIVNGKQVGSGEVPIEKLDAAIAEAQAVK